ncbi:organic hydroperoxide resistance protein [Rufibacter sediminis]|uniref:Organic hydroperoxide resistance protein n=1 Tax=Rufibacter sediminis TaxID=2762756 RepID=A0ABR6VVA7_9BACT|nr:organic hydroperoxide resistance protein [Rufibacter sediminis]MBC3541122.1 organic hydroperoxide resistance protein [Rufibacter sediminis]
MKRMYTAEVTATGGRSGQIKSTDGILDMPVRLPEGLGGKGGATNPEQLFAAGYAACFQSALMLVAGKQKIRLDENSTVTAQVGLDQFEDGRFGLAVQLDVKVDGVDKAKAEELVAQAHEVCPYSVGTRGNIDVKLNVLD